MAENDQTDKKCSMVDTPPPDPGEGEFETPALGRDQILSAVDMDIRKIPIPEWSGDVFIRSMSAGEWDDFENSLVKITDGGKQKANLKNYRARFASIIICDADGNKLFLPSDITNLSKKSRKAMDRILTAGKKLNGISDEDESELVENLEPTPDADS